MTCLERSYITGLDRRQLILFPDTLDAYVDEENPVRFIDAFVERLELKALGFDHCEPVEAGRPSYDPGDMLRLYIYGYLNQVRSSRRLERECHRNVEVMWLMKRLAPDFKTIADFRKDNVGCIKRVFKEFIYICKSLDLFGGELVGIDSSKFRAVNSRKRNLNRQTLKMNLKRVEERVEVYLRELEENDRLDQDAEASAKAEGIREKIRKLEEKRKEYLALSERMERTGESEVSLTDPDSRLMKIGQGMDVCYNAHVAVDAESKLIAAYEVTNNASDGNWLSPMAISAKDALGVDRIDATADVGYNDSSEIKRCVDHGVKPYVPEQKASVRGASKKAGIPRPEFHEDRFAYDVDSDAYICPAGQRLKFRYWSVRNERMIGLYATDACKACPFFMTACTLNRKGRIIQRWEHEAVIEEMRRRLRSDEGAAIVSKRKELVEHPFGTIKRSFNQGYMLMKGLRKVTGEMGLTMLAYNMRRAINILGTRALMASTIRKAT